MWTSNSTLSIPLLSAVLPPRPTTDPAISSIAEARYEYKELKRSTMDSGVLCADLLVRVTNGKSLNANYFSLHPQYLLEEIKQLTGSNFELAENPGRTVRFLHDGIEVYESKGTALKCSMHSNCANAINMRTWWNITNSNRPPATMLPSDVDCTNCGSKGHLAVYCVERMGYVRLIFTMNHVDARAAKNMTAPRHFPEAEPALLLLPMPLVLPEDDLVDTLFNLP